MANILIGVTGGIAAYKIADLCSALIKNEQVKGCMLPVVQIGDKKYFVDGRCRELRNVDDFMDKITWDEVNSWDDEEYAAMEKKGWTIELTECLMTWGRSAGRED